MGRWITYRGRHIYLKDGGEGGADAPAPPPSSDRSFTGGGGHYAGSGGAPDLRALAKSTGGRVSGNTMYHEGDPRKVGRALEGMGYTDVGTQMERDKRGYESGARIDTYEHGAGGRLRHKIKGTKSEVYPAD